MSDSPRHDAPMDTILDADALASIEPDVARDPVAADAAPESTAGSTLDDPDTLVSRAPDAKGTFERTPLVYVLVHVLDRRFSGMLVVRSEGTNVALLTLRDGAVVRVDTRSEGDRLGEEAVAASACTEPEVSAALARAQADGALLGEKLVALAGVSADTVEHLLVVQMVKRVTALVNLPKETAYALHLGDRERAPLEPWAPLDVVLAAVRAWGDRGRIHGTVRHLGAQTLRLHPEAVVKELRATPAERQALDVLAAGESTLETLYRTIGSGLSSLVYMLAVTRQLRSGQDDRAPMGISSGRAPEPEPGFRPPSPTPPGPAPSRVSPPIVIAPLERPVTESFARAGTHPGAASGVPRVTAPYPLGARVPTPAGMAAVGTPESLAPPPAITPLASTAPPAAPLAPPPPVAAPVSKSTLPSATAPPGVAPASAGLPPVPAPPIAPPTVPSASSSPPSIPIVAKTTLVSASAPQPPARPLPPLPSRAAAAARPPPPPAPEEPFDPYKAVDAALARHDLNAAEKLVHAATRTAPRDPGLNALFEWVTAHSGEDNALPEAVRALTRILDDQPKCAPALYYRGMLLKRAGKDKSALRDFVMVLYDDPTHVGALSAVRELRKNKR